MTTITSTEAFASGRYINLGSVSALDDTIKTIVCYCKPTGLSGASASYIMAKTPSGSTAGPRMYLNSASGTKLNYGETSTSSGFPIREGGTSVTLDTWQHLIATVDKSGVLASQITTFIDGTSTGGGGTNGSGTLGSDASSDLFLGNRGNSGSLAREFVGDVAYWAFYGAVLDSTQITNVITNGPLAELSDLIVCFANDTVFYGDLDAGETVTVSARSTRVTGSTPPNTALGDGADTDAPILSSGSATETSDTTATLGATTDEGNGTLYWVVTASATEPSAAQVKLGDDHADADAAYADSDAVGSTGAKTNNATGLTASTAYYAYAMHEDAAANQSDVLYLGTFTTDAANAAPSWSGTPSAMSSKRGQAYTPQDITSLVSDADLDTLAYTITGAPTGVTIHSSTGIISGTPTAAPGVYACTVEADDGIASPVASSSFNITVVQAELALDSAGYEFGDGNAPATMAVVASTELQVAVYPLTEWPPATAIATATATTGTNGRLADLGDDDLSYGTTYRVVARNAADGETWAWTMTAS